MLLLTVVIRAQLLNKVLIKRTYRIMSIDSSHRTFNLPSQQRSLPVEVVTVEYVACGAASATGYLPRGSSLYSAQPPVAEALMQIWGTGRLQPTGKTASCLKLN